MSDINDDPTPPTCQSCGKPFIDHAGIQRTCADLLKAKELIALQDSLLVCYRLGKHPSDKTLDRMHKLREELNNV